MHFFILFFLLTNLLFSNDINSLLKEYESAREQSLQTVDEKLGHVVIYSKKELRLMQYTKLSDILKELPLLNYNKNRYGLSSSSLLGTKTEVSGFFRFYINDHEVSSISSQTASFSWSDMPLDFIDHIEIYYGDSSFSLGNETGIYFIRIYTKDATKENSNEIRISNSNKNSSSKSFTHSRSFKSSWNYLLFASTNKKDDKIFNENTSLSNKEEKRYIYLDINNETHNINLGYTDTKKDNFTGLSLDGSPDSSKTKSKDFFINIKKYFLEDKSIKTMFSYTLNENTYEEENSSGLSYIPFLDFSNMGGTLLKDLEEELKYTKTDASISKEYEHKKNKLISSFYFTNKTYKVKSRLGENLLGTKVDIGSTHDFDEENIYSLSLEDYYTVDNNLMLIANLKVNKYDRKGYIKDSSDTHIRFGGIYTPYDNFGLKSFYTQTTLPVSFYNVDFVDKNSPDIKPQEYKYYTLEGVFTSTNSKFGITYNNVNIDNFLYLSPVGFINIDHTIKTQGLIFNYEYNFNESTKLHLNYHTSRLSENLNNSNKGAYVKYMGEYEKLSYFTSLVYRNSYSYEGAGVKSSYDLSLGSTYNISKDLSFSVKGENLLNKSASSLYELSFGSSNYALENYSRKVSMSLKWVF